jgi:hypothetical protein
MATYMTVETMKQVFMSYFDAHNIKGVNIQIHGTGVTAEGTWQIPPETFDVDPSVKTVWFRGTIPHKGPTDNNAKPAQVTLRTQNGSTVKHIYPIDPTQMLDSLTAFFPIMETMEDETTPESASVITTLNKTNEILANIQHILQRIEEGSKERVSQDPE